MGKLEMQERSMNQMNRRTMLTIANAVAVAALAGAVPSASAQTVIDTMPATTSAAQTPVAKPKPNPKVPTSATPRMIQEAIQRSQARTDNLKALGKQEQFGSEEPFTFKPAAPAPAFDATLESFAADPANQ